MIYVTLFGYRQHFFKMTAMICTLLFLLSFGARAGADSLTVTATVPAPLPSLPALITSPVNGEHVDTNEITVQGTCSNDTAYVEIYRNNTFAGADLCTNGTFSLVITLIPGANILQAKPFSSTAGEGPRALSLTIYYDIPEPPPLRSQPLPQESRPPPFVFSPQVRVKDGSTFDALFITIPQTYTIYRPGERISWLLRVYGGTAPFVSEVDWGDEQRSRQEFHTTTYLLDHTYDRPGYYLVKITATDSYDNRASLQLLVIVKGEPTQTAADIVDRDNNDRTDIITFLALVVVIGGIVLVLIFRRSLVYSVRYALKIFKKKE